jgi:hypothetical protein
MSKVVQIAAATDEGDAMLSVLRDDGTMWRHFYHTTRGWIWERIDPPPGCDPALSRAAAVERVVAVHGRR